MRKFANIGFGLLFAVAILASIPASAQQQQKPNILFVMGDDIGIMNVGAYHQGLMVGETPNIDRLAKEGARFMTAYAEQSCTAGRTSFATGMNPLRAGMIMPQLPGSTSSLLPGTPHIAKFLLDLGYNTGEFGKNHLGDKAASNGPWPTGVLGLSVSPGRDAGRELSGHQQDICRLWRRRARTIQSADSPTPRARSTRGPRCA